MSLHKCVRKLTPHALAFVAAAFFLIGWFGNSAVLHLTGTALLALGTAACATFVWLYRPIDPAKHSRAGRHLLAMTWCLLALFGVSLYGALGGPLGQRAGPGITLGIVAGLVYVAWERVYLRQWEIKHRKPKDHE